MGRELTLHNLMVAKMIDTSCKEKYTVCNMTKRNEYIIHDQAFCRFILFICRYLLCIIIELQVHVMETILTLPTLCTSNSSVTVKFYKTFCSCECCLVTPYVDINLIQHLLRYCFDVWWHSFIPFSYVDLSKESCTIRHRATSQATNTNLTYRIFRKLRYQNYYHIFQGPMS